MNVSGQLATVRAAAIFSSLQSWWQLRGLVVSGQLATMRVRGQLATVRVGGPLAAVRVGGQLFHIASLE